MKTPLCLMIFLAGTVFLAACSSPGFIERRYAPSRVALPDAALPNPPEQTNMATTAPGATSETTPTTQLGLPAPPVITGTWTFTTPPTVTRTMKKTADLMQYALYMGRPAANDTPVVVITVAPRDPAADAGAPSIAQQDPATYKIQHTRTYVLNGNVANECTGLTSVGAAFSELILSRPGGSGDICHVMAVARNDAERKLALEVLSSITWTPNTSDAQSGTAGDATATATSGQ